MGDEYVINIQLLDYVTELAAAVNLTHESLPAADLLPTPNGGVDISWPHNNLACILEAPDNILRVVTSTSDHPTLQNTSSKHFQLPDELQEAAKYIRTFLCNKLEN